MYHPILTDEQALAIAGVLYAAAEAAERHGRKQRASELRAFWSQFLEECGKTHSTEAR